MNPMTHLLETGTRSISLILGRRERLISILFASMIATHSPFGAALAYGSTVGHMAKTTIAEAVGIVGTAFAFDEGASTTRYVATSGDDSGNDCSDAGAPCATLTHTISQSTAGDLIEVAAGTYTEPGLLVDRDVTIRGAGSASTILQAAPSPIDRNTVDFCDPLPPYVGPVLIVDTLVVAHIDGITVRNGFAENEGAGIRNRGNLTLVDVVVTKNTVAWEQGFVKGGGIFNTASISMNRVSVRDNLAATSSEGAGIYNSGDLNAVSSVIDDNAGETCVIGVADGVGLYNTGTASLSLTSVSLNVSGSDGDGVAGISNRGTLAVDRSVFHFNVTDDAPSAIGSWGGSVTAVNATTFSSNGSYGPLIECSGSCTITNSTISGNSTESELFYGVVDMVSSTIVDNRWWGGVGSVRAKSSIIAGNTTTGSPDGCHVNRIDSYGYNLIADVGGCPVTEVENPGTDIIGADPLVGPLADNGGPTPTHALLENSTAIDAGSCTDLSGMLIELDQRGEPRSDGSCDIGSFEFQAPLEPEDRIEALADDIDDLVDSGVLGAGKGNALIAKLTAAIKKLEDGKPRVALNLLHAFVNHVESLVGEGEIPEAEGSALIETANSIISQIEADLASGKTDGSVADAGDENPDRFSLDSVYPNPFNPSTTISFVVSEETDVTIAVFDLLGRHIHTLVDRSVAAGSHRIMFEAVGLPSGLYLVRMITPHQEFVERMLLLR